MMNMGVYNAALGNTEKGLEFQLKAKEIIENSPDDPGKVNVLGITYSQIGNTYIKLNNYEEGLDYLKKGVQFIESSSIQFDKTRILGIAYDNLAKGYKGVSAFEDALKAQLKSIELMETIHTKSTPELATVYNNAANLLTELGRYDEAENYSKKTLEMRLKVQSPEHPQVIQSYLTRANIFLQKENYNESLLIIKKILPILESEDWLESEDLVQAYQIQGINLVKLESPDIGLRQFEKSIAIRNNMGLGDIIIHTRDEINLGALYYEAGNFQKSEQHLLAALEIIEKDYAENKADLGLVYWNLAKLYKKKKNLEKAYLYQDKGRAIFEEIYSREHPLNEKMDILVIELEAMKGSKLYMNEDYSNALKHFLFIISKRRTFKIISREDDNTLPVYQLIGSCYYQLKEYNKAIKAFHNAMQVYPEYEFGDYYNDIGLSHFKIDELDEAKDAFDKYVEVKPNEWRPYRNLALYYAEIKKTKLAISNLDKAIQLGFNDKKWLKKNKSFDILAKNTNYKKLLKDIE